MGLINQVKEVEKPGCPRPGPCRLEPQCPRPSVTLPLSGGLGLFPSQREPSAPSPLSGSHPPSPRGPHLHGRVWRVGGDPKLGQCAPLAVRRVPSALSPRGWRLSKQCHRRAMTLHAKTTGPSPEAPAPAQSWGNWADPGLGPRGGAGRGGSSSQSACACSRPSLPCCGVSAQPFTLAPPGRNTAPRGVGGCQVPE